VNFSQHESVQIRIIVRKGREEIKSAAMGRLLGMNPSMFLPLEGVQVNFVVRNRDCMGLLSQSMQAGQRPLALV
jgi:hypothetical protein